jgi:hypothetical protein
MSNFIDPFEEEDEFQDDSDTKAVLELIDTVIGKREDQESYGWLCNLEQKIADRVEALQANPDVQG